MSVHEQLPLLSQVGVRELRQEASAILRRVKAGEAVEVTEHGKPVARLVPIQESSYERMVAAGLITTPASSPELLTTGDLIKLPTGSRSASEVLISMRNEERF